MKNAAVCRPALEACDIAETCNGTDNDCPADVLSSSATICRAAAGPCDVAESCTGTSATCPPNGFASSTAICRPSAGICDIAEHCPGSAAACPADALQSAGTICRVATSPCDAPELCSGLATTCPSDGQAPTGTSCDDGRFCTTSDQCSAGSCIGTPRVCDDGDACTTDQCDEAIDQCTTAASPCDDGNPCTTDTCGPGDACTHVPRTGESCDAAACRTGTVCQADATCGSGTPKDCSALDDACTKGVCDPRNGQCVEQPADDPQCSDACLLVPDATICPACDLACGAGSCVADTADECSLGLPTAGSPPIIVIIVLGPPGVKCKARIRNGSLGKRAWDGPTATLRAKSARVRGGSATRKIPDGGRVELPTKIKLNRVARKLLEQGGSLDAEAEVAVKGGRQPKKLLRRLIKLVKSS